MFDVNTFTSRDSAAKLASQPIHFYHYTNVTKYFAFFIKINEWQLIAQSFKGSQKGSCMHHLGTGENYTQITF